MKYGRVIWFDNDKGEGEIFSEIDNSIYYFHYSSINSNDKYKTANKGDIVEFSLYENLYMKQVDKCKIMNIKSY